MVWSVQTRRGMFAFLSLISWLRLVSSPLSVIVCLFLRPRGNEVTERPICDGFCRRRLFFFFAWHFRNKFSFEAYISVTIEDTPMGFGIPFNNFARNIFAEKNFRKSFGNLGFFSKNVQNPTSFTWAESSIGANSPSQGPHWYTNAYSERPLGYGLPSSCVFVRQVFL